LGFCIFTGRLSLKAGHLITRLCARIKQSTKEAKVMSDINQSPNGDSKSKSSTTNKPRVKVKRVTPDEAREFRKRMGLCDSYLVIGNTIISS
jgi:hypothetical protein